MDEVLWAVGRASGVVALLLLTVSLWLGIVTRSGRPLPGMPRFSVTLLHRNVSLLAVVFLVLHIGTLLLDSYAKLTLTDVLVPFLGAHLPFWLGLGTVAVDLLIAVTVTALLRRRPADQHLGRGERHHRGGQPLPDCRQHHLGVPEPRALRRHAGVATAKIDTDRPHCHL